MVGPAERGARRRPQHGPLPGDGDFFDYDTRPPRGLRLRGDADLKAVASYVYDEVPRPDQRPEAEATAQSARFSLNGRSCPPDREVNVGYRSQDSRTPGGGDELLGPHAGAALTRQVGRDAVVGVYASRTTPVSAYEENAFYVSTAAGHAAGAAALPVPVRGGLGYQWNDYRTVASAIVAPRETDPRWYVGLRRPVRSNLYLSGAYRPRTARPTSTPSPPTHRVHFQLDGTSSAIPAMSPSPPSLCCSSRRPRSPRRGFPPTASGRATCSRWWWTAGRTSRGCPRQDHGSVCSPGGQWRCGGSPPGDRLEGDPAARGRRPRLASGRGPRQEYLSHSSGCWRVRQPGRKPCAAARASWTRSSTPRLPDGASGEVTVERPGGLRERRPLGALPLRGRDPDPRSSSSSPAAPRRDRDHGGDPRWVT